MRKRLVTLLLTALLVMAAWPVTASAAPGGTINVYNWGQYISDGTDGSLDVIAAFEEETGIKVNYVTFDSNETMYTKLKPAAPPTTLSFRRTTWWDGSLPKICWSP